MTSKIQKWGNSLAVRIPSAFIKENHISEGAEIDIFSTGNQIIIKVNKNKYNLEEMLDKVNENNTHEEIDMGISEGREIW